MEAIIVGNADHKFWYLTATKSIGISVKEWSEPNSKRCLKLADKVRQKINMYTGSSDFNWAILDRTVCHLPNRVPAVGFQNEFNTVHMFREPPISMTIGSPKEQDQTKSASHKTELSLQKPSSGKNVQLPEQISMPSKEKLLPNISYTKESAQTTSQDSQKSPSSPTHSSEKETIQSPDKSSSTSLQASSQSS